MSVSTSESFHAEVVRANLTIGEQWQHQLVGDGECSAVELQQQCVLLVHHGDGDHIARAGDLGLFGEVQCHPAEFSNTDRFRHMGSAERVQHLRGVRPGMAATQYPGARLPSQYG